MVETAGMAEIRGIDIDKLAKGYAEEENILKRYLTVTPTSAREIRWYSKTAGFLATAQTEGIGATTEGTNISERSRPPVVNQSWTRNTNYVRKYFWESELISMEDIKDCDIDILGAHIKDVVRLVERQVDSRIYTVLTTGTGVQTAGSTSEWDVAATANPIKDIMKMRQAIRDYSYNPQGAILALNPYEERVLLEWLISVKGSSIPQFASLKLETGELVEILGCKVVVSANFTTDQALLFVPNVACTWKSFMPITTAEIVEPGIGTKIRAWEEGEAILVHPKASYLLTNTKT